MTIKTNENRLTKTADKMQQKMTRNSSKIADKKYNKNT